ncbi:MAG TPA: hypothetical protein VMU18_00825 [Rhodoblastus sp.]|nr:hypothetical protein [Rhodoblastus sp.]
MRLIATAVLFIFLAVPAGAEDQPPPEAVIAFGVSHPECREWGDGCVICARREATLNCSTPGIACQPSAPACKDPAK